MTEPISGKVLDDPDFLLQPILGEGHTPRW
jgi:hypothetical protein